MVVSFRGRSRRAVAGGLLLAAAALVVSGVSVGAIAAREDVVRACASKRTGALRVLAKGKRCRKHERRITWSRHGPAGRQGAAGAPGPTGERGPTGATGATGAAAASIVMGSTDAQLGAVEFGYLPPAGKSPTANSGADAQVSPNAPIVVRDLYVRIDNPPGAGAARTFELLDDGRAALSCTMRDTQDACDSGETAVTVAAGSDLMFKFDVGPTPATPAPGLRWSFRVLGP